MTRIFASAALYFAMVFGVGFALGPIRVLFLEPRVGTLVAVLCEAPFLFGAMVVASRVAPRILRVASDTGPMLCVGLVALVFQQIADAVVGVSLRGISLAQQLARFATVEGAVYASLLILFAIVPALVNRAR